MNILIYCLLVIIILYLISNLIYKNEFNSNISLIKLKHLNYNPEIRTCVLISGQIRDKIYECIMSQKIFIFDPLNVDIFAVFSDNVSDDVKKYVIKLLKPKRILWVKDNKNTNKNLSLPLSSYLMTDKILQCNDLKKEYEIKNNFHYDINIKTRIDIIIKNYIPENIINNIQKNTIYYPTLNSLDIFTNSVYGITDQILLGNNESMNIFSNIYNYIITTNNSNTNIIEIFLKNYLNNNKIKTVKINNFKFILTKFISDDNNIEILIKNFINDKNKSNYLNIFNII